LCHRLRDITVICYYKHLDYQSLSALSCIRHTKGSDMSEPPITAAEPQNGGDGGGRSSRPKPTRILPTDRIRYDKQQDILRAVAAASGHERKAVTNREVGAIVDMADSTIAQIIPFFADIGLIVREKKADSKGFVPAPEVAAYHKAYEWDKGNAAKKMAPLLAGAWFTDALMPKLKFRPVNEKEAINDLAEIASVGPDKEASLRTIIDYMVGVGLVERDISGMLRVVAGSPDVPGIVAPVVPVVPPAAQVPPKPAGVSEHQLWLLEILNAYPDLEEEDQNAILKLIKTIKGKKNAPRVAE
jgi:hypothetical protein